MSRSSLPLVNDVRSEISTRSFSDTGIGLNHAFQPRSHNAGTVNKREISYMFAQYMHIIDIR